MRALVQRVKSSSVSVDGEQISRIDYGLLVLVGIFKTDTEKDVEVLAKKLPKLRIFAGDGKDMNKSVLDVGGKILLVSQFTLTARTKGQNRPSFIDAMEPDSANLLFDMLYKKMSQVVPVELGEFGSYMEVKLTNTGPVTIMIDT